MMRGSIRRLFGATKREIMEHEPPPVPVNPPQRSITCPLCARTSYHPQDIEQKYCGACNWWTGNPELLAGRIEQWISEYFPGGKVPEGCTFHPDLLAAMVLVYEQR